MSFGIKINFRNDAADLARFAVLRSRIPMAIADGLNDGGDKTRTAVMRAAWKHTGVKQYKSVTSRFKSYRANAGVVRGLFGPAVPSMSYIIQALGPAIPIGEFPVKRVAAGVEAAPWANARVFSRSFQIMNADGSYRKDGWRARRNSNRMSIRKLYGSNLAKELIGATPGSPLPQMFHAAAKTNVPPAILKRLSAIIARG